MWTEWAIQIGTQKVRMERDTHNTSEICPLWIIYLILEAGVIEKARKANDNKKRYSASWKQQGRTVSVSTCGVM
jgi:hypothetical protein